MRANYSIMIAMRSSFIPQHLVLVAVIASLAQNHKLWGTCVLQPHIFMQVARCQRFLPFAVKSLSEGGHWEFRGSRRWMTGHSQGVHDSQIAFCRGRGRRSMKVTPQCELFKNKSGNGTTTTSEINVEWMVAHKRWRGQRPPRQFEGVSYARIVILQYPSIC